MIVVIINNNVINSNNNVSNFNNNSNNNARMQRSNVDLFMLFRHSNIHQQIYVFHMLHDDDDDDESLKTQRSIIHISNSI